MPNRAWEWDVANPPPAGHADVGPFVMDLFAIARNDRDARDLPRRWMQNYRLYRGHHWTNPSAHRLVVNLFGANVNRTTANITARDPAPEIKLNPIQSNPGLLLNFPDELNPDTILTDDAKYWWSAVDAQITLSEIVQHMETYGITVGKMRWDIENARPQLSIIAPWSWFPFPQKVSNPNELPCICQLHVVSTARLKAKYSRLAPEIISDHDGTITGDDRTKYTPYAANSPSAATARASSYAGDDMSDVIECWLRDDTNPQAYPDGIRRITICNGGRLVLHDDKNPNINWEINDRNKLATSYAWGKFPFFFANSYTDDASIWGYSSAEQIAFLNFKIDKIVSRLVRRLELSLSPTLVISQDSTIDPASMTNGTEFAPYITPETAAAAAGIYWLTPPPSNGEDYRVLDLLIQLFDRVSQIEDADRGVGPRGVVAASGIAALQERGAVLIRHKIRSVDSLIKEMIRFWVSMQLNFGINPRKITLEEDVEYIFRPMDFLGLNFEVLIESGSTVAKSQIVLEQQAMQLFAAGIADDRYVLDALNAPNKEQLLERKAENMLGQALTVLAQAGYPPDGAYDSPLGSLPPLVLLKSWLELNQSAGEQPAAPMPPTPAGIGGESPGAVAPEMAASSVSVPMPEEMQ